MRTKRRKQTMSLTITPQTRFNSTRPSYLPQSFVGNDGAYTLPIRNDDLAPPRPLEIKQPGNPMSWMEGIIRLQSAAQKWMAAIQSKLTEASLGGEGIDPVNLRHMMSQAAALIGKMYDLEDYAKKMQKQNQESEKDTFELAMPAKGRG